MRVTVEGIVTTIEKQEKDGKVFTNLFLVQKGEREQVQVRLKGDRVNDFSEFENARFEGRLLVWKSRDRIGTMVLV